MQHNDLSVEITAEARHEIWQKAKRICLRELHMSPSRGHEKISRLCPQCKMTEDTYDRCMWSGHKIAHCWANIVQEPGSIFGAGCDVNRPFLVLLVGRFRMQAEQGCCLHGRWEPRSCSLQDVSSSFISFHYCNVFYLFIYS